MEQNFELKQLATKETKENSNVEKGYILPTSSGGMIAFAPISWGKPILTALRGSGMVAAEFPNGIKLKYEVVHDGPRRWLNVEGVDSVEPSPSVKIHPKCYEDSVDFTGRSSLREQIDLEVIAKRLSLL